MCICSCFRGLNLSSGLLFGGDCHQTPVELLICKFWSSGRPCWNPGILFCIRESGAADLGVELENIPMPGAVCTCCRAHTGVLMRDSAHHKPETLENISKNANLHVLGLIEEISDGKISLSLRKPVLNTNCASPLDITKSFQLLCKPVRIRKVVGSLKFSSKFQTFFIFLDISMGLLHQAWRICGILHQTNKKEA